MVGFVIYFNDSGRGLVVLSFSISSVFYGSACKSDSILQMFYLVYI